MINLAEQRFILVSRIFGVALILVVSFLYGLGVGMKRREAQASFAANIGQEVNGTTHLVSGVDLPAGVELFPLGRDMAINGVGLDAVSFKSARSVGDLLEEQLRIWRARGLSPFGSAGKQRAVAVARDESTGARFSFVVWEALLPDKVSSPAKVEGLLSVSRASEVLGGEEEQRGVVPGVPLMPGGKAGAVFRSAERGGESFSGSYTIPTIASGVSEYYRDLLRSEGWSENEAFASSALPMAQLSFSRGGEELHLLMSPIVKPEGNVGTLLFIIRLPSGAASGLEPRFSSQRAQGGV